MLALTRLSLGTRSLVGLVGAMTVGFGLYAAGALPRALFPSLQFPSALVLTSYQGASPRIVEREVTEPLEGAVEGSGVARVTSESRKGVSSITVEYEYGTETDQAVRDLRQAVGSVRGRLPDNVDPNVLPSGTANLPGTPPWECPPSSVC